MFLNQDDKSLRGRLVGSVFTLTVIALLLVMAVTSYCWFAESRSVHAGGMTVSCETPDIFDVRLEVFPVTEISEQEKTYTFDSAVTDFDNTMPMYDPSDINFSKYKKALVLKFTYSLHYDSTVTLDWLAASGINLTDPCDLSTAIQVWQASVTGETATAGDTARSFVTVSDGSASKTTSLQYSLPGLAGENTVWFIIQYNQSVMDYISKRYMADSTIPETIHYINDIDFLFSMEGE